VNFLDKKNNHIHSIMKLKPLYRYLILISTLFTITTIWFLCVHSKLKTQIKKYKNDISQINKNQKIIITQQEDCKSLSKSIKNLKHDLCLQSKNNTTELDISIPLNYAKESKLNLESCITAEKQSHKNFYKKKAVYEFSGTLSQLLAFCSKLKLCNKTIECEEINIANPNQNHVNIKCSLKFFYPK